LISIKALATAGALAVITVAPAAAQVWPTRTVTMVVPYAAGGPADVIARVLAPGISNALGQQVIVENVGGAGGVTGADHVARAAPDGYQFLLGPTGVLAMNQTLFKHPLYNSAVDLAPVGLIATAPPVLIARKDFPANNLEEFVAYAKGHPGALQFGSSGVGSGPHITCVLLDAAAGISAVHVPYRGAMLAYQDLLPGRIDYMCDFISTALPEIKSQSVKALATLTRERTPMLPNLATADEQGLTGFDAPGWYALVLPKGTPNAIVRRLNKALSVTLDSTAVKDRLTQLGNTVVPPAQRTPEYLARFISSEIAKWAGPIKASGTSM
jgi:tripartite-type tricarboxylate transporter receptor subunit TctC